MNTPRIQSSLSATLFSTSQTQLCTGGNGRPNFSTPYRVVQRNSAQPVGVKKPFKDHRQRIKHEMQVRYKRNCEWRDNHLYFEGTNELVPDVPSISPRNR